MMNKKYQAWGGLVLRLIIGYGFIAHGWAKLSRGPAGFGRLLEQIGVPFPHQVSWAATFTELLGGIAIFAGAFVSIAAIPLICTMLVAMFSIHLKYGFSTIKTIGLTPQGPLFGPPGFEMNLLYIGGLIAIMLSGAGIFSVDSLIADRRSTRKKQF